MNNGFNSLQISFLVAVHSTLTNTLVGVNSITNKLKAGCAKAIHTEATSDRDTRLQVHNMGGAFHLCS